MADLARWSLARRVLAVVVLAACGAIAALALASSGAAAAGPSCTVSWANPVTGSWADASKWSTGVVPGELDDVCIDVAGTYTLTLDGDVSVHSLDLADRAASRGCPSSATTRPPLLG